jgi:hypothetical protein
MRMLKVRGDRGQTLFVNPRDVAYITAGGGARRTKIVFKSVDGGEPMEFEAQEEISALSLKLAEALEGEPADSQA